MQLAGCGAQDQVAIDYDEAAGLVSSECAIAIL